MNVQLKYEDISTCKINGLYLIILTEKLKKFIEQYITDCSEISVYYYDLITRKLTNHVLDSSLLHKYICLPFPFYNHLKKYVNINLDIEHVEKKINNKIKLKKKLTEPQQQLRDMCYKYFKKCIKTREPFTLLISEETGFGKTLTTIGLLSKIKEKTVIFAKTSLIQEAWKDECFDCKEIDYWVSSDGVSKFKFKKTPSDILIVSVNHLKNPRFIKYILNEYSIYVFDEIHNYNLTNNAESLVAEFIIRNMLKKSIFITGTPRDNCFMYYGNPISVKYRSKIKNLILFNIMENIPTIQLKSDKLSTLQKIKERPDSYNARRNGFISLNDYERNNLICSYIEMNTYINESRSLVLTSSIEHIHTIYEMLASKFSKKITKKFSNEMFIFDGIVVVKFLSKRKKHIQDVYKKYLKKDSSEIMKYVIITTYQFAGAGANIPGLNTLFIVCPGLNSTDAKQAAGRIMRIEKKNNIDILRSIYIFSMTSVDKSFDIKITKSFSGICENLRECGWNLKNIHSRNEYVSIMKSFFKKKN